jgi:hypothetical protein
MKLKALVLIACLLPILGQAGEVVAKPAVLVDEVLAIAKKSLAERNYNHVFIEKISLEQPSFFAKQPTWWVQWSAPVQGSKPTVKEIGLSIRMDGSVVHVVQK